MRWRKANRNRKRVLSRKARIAPIPPSYFNPAHVSWREWLDKIFPNLAFPEIQNDSVIARWRRPEPTPSHVIASEMARHPFSPRPFHERIGYLAYQMWLSQQEKCAECGAVIPFEQATKRSHSFKIICQTCRESKPAFVMIVDDIDAPSPATPSIEEAIANKPLGGLENPQ